MQYKTIILELLQQRPKLHNQLRSNRTLLLTLNRYARQLKTSHEAWKERFSQAKPNNKQTQIASEALEFALKEIEHSLTSKFSPDERLSIEELMAFIRRQTPPA